jgi:hypothetical protein
VPIHQEKISFEDNFKFIKICRERSASVLPEEADEIKSLKSERSIVERSLSMSSLQSQQRQQQHHDTAVLEEESENHPSVAELLASAKLSR